MTITMRQDEIAERNMNLAELVSPEHRICFVCDREVKLDDADLVLLEPSAPDEYRFVFHDRCGHIADLKESNEIASCALCGKDICYVQFADSLHEDLFCFDCKDKWKNGK